MADYHPPYCSVQFLGSIIDLWKIDRFEDFIEERKRLIREKFSYLLTQKGGGNAVAQTGQ